jgi:hypothetical protein
MNEDDVYEEPSGAFSKARSHIMLIVGLLAAAGAASWLESLDPEACKPVASPHAVDLSLDRA